jgi:hypothetical protein
MALVTGQEVLAACNFTLPNNTQTSFGSGSSTMNGEGNIYRLATTGVSPVSTGSENVLAVYSLPASSFDIAGRGINILAQGAFGATANNKTVQIVFNPTTAVVGSAVTGGTVVATSGVVATNNLGWALEANVFKYGVNGSNTQLCIHQSAQTGGTISPLLAPQLTTANESANILVAFCGNAATATTDITLNFAEINALN